jgi:signal transduction histidine kinase
LKGPGRALVPIAIAGVAAGCVPLLLGLAGERADGWPLLAVLGPLVTWAFVGTGLFAWLRRPASRVGQMMVAVGFIWSVSTLTLSEDGRLFMVGFLATPVTYVALFHTLLAFPDGRLHSRLERVLVATAYVSATVVHLGVALFFDPLGGPGGLPENPLLVGDPELGETLGRARAALGTLLVAAMVVILLRRRSAAKGSQRRALLPVLATGALVAALLALWLVARVGGLTEAQRGLEDARLVVLALVPFAYLAGLLHSRVAGAAAVSELVARLGEPRHRRGGLQTVLAEALGDPSLAIAYWLPARSGYVDVDGNEVELPLERPGRVCVPVESGGARIAAILYDAELDLDAELVRAVGAAASLTLENERLDAELRAKVDQLRASRARIVESSDAARRRIERDLHDGAQQRLVSLALSLKMLESKLGGNTEAVAELAASRRELEHALAELRELGRGIHPPVLSDRGLGAVLESLAHRAPLPVELDAAPGERLPERVESTAYFVAAEALTNVARYSRASHARIGLRREDGHVVLEITDDGVGGADPAAGSGLRGLLDRVAAVDGSLEVDSPAGGGTVVRATIPCA